MRNTILYTAITILSMIMIHLSVTGQQLEIEWDGNKEDVIRLMDGDTMRFSIEGHTDAVPDRITFKIRNGDTLINALTLYEGGTVRLDQVDTVITGGTTVIRLPDGTLGVREYAVGDMAFGGVVFWVDETGEHGLVSSMSDIVSHLWADTLLITGATGKGIGSGAMNTILIVSSNRENTDSAARHCADLVEGGYGDWYLPSKGELNLMYTKLHLVGLGGFTSTIFWSSEESDSDNAWVQNFSNGDKFSSDKNFSSNAVRAIRAF